MSQIVQVQINGCEEEIMGFCQNLFQILNKLAVSLTIEN